MCDVEPPTLAELRRLAAAQLRATRKLETAVLAAADAGMDQTQVAAAVGHSREYIRGLRKRRDDGKLT